MKYDLRKLQLIARNKEWLAADFPLATKLRYYPAMATSLVNSLSGRKKQVNYMGARFKYDHIVTPLNLQNYPYEITHKILRNIDKPIRKALDIGGNIGQFPITLAAVAPTIEHIDVLEPNPGIYPLLEHNVQNMPNIHTYNYAVAAGKGLTFYYEEGRSAIGSFIKENAGSDESMLKQVNVKTTKDVAKLTKCKHYDLITIDVEGYEYDLLPLLKGITTQYLYLEASGAGRAKQYDHSQLFAAVATQFGAFDILYQSELIGKMDTIEYLFCFKS